VAPRNSKARPATGGISGILLLCSRLPGSFVVWGQDFLWCGVSFFLRARFSSLHTPREARYIIAYN
jgi:hypothetical protein